MEVARRKISSLFRENELVRIQGRVMRIFETRSTIIYTVFDESGEIEVVSDYEAKRGEILDIEGKTRARGNVLQIYAINVKTLSGEEAERIDQEIEAALEKQSNPLHSEFLIKDRHMEEMGPDIERAARIIRKAVFEMRPILIRHHNDCDGITGALLVKKAISELMDKENFDQEAKKKLLYTNQNNSAIYETIDALRDINIFRSIDSDGRPLIILIDFSSNSNSIDSLSLLRGANFEIILIDHHPPDADIGSYVDCFISTWARSGDSNYPAGLLAGEVAKKIYKINADEIQTLSLIGDKSRLIGAEKENKELKKKALVLDFLGTYSKFPNTLEFYESVFYNQKIVDSLYKQATSKIEASKKIAMEYVKIKDLENGFKLCLARLDRAVKKGEFPGKGKLTSEIHDEFKLKVDAPLVTIGYGGSSINFRANRKAKENGFDANRLITNLRNELKNAIASGGGHDVAAGLKVNKGFGKIVLEEIIKNIGEIKTK